MEDNFTIYGGRFQVKKRFFFFSKTIFLWYFGNEKTIDCSARNDILTQKNDIFTQKNDIFKQKNDIFTQKNDIVTQKCSKNDIFKNKNDFLKKPLYFFLNVLLHV